MNPLLRARKQLREVLAKRKALLAKLVEEARKATDAEDLELKSLAEEKDKWEGLIKQLEEVGDDDPAGSSQEDRGAAGGTRVVRGEYENDKGDFVPFKQLGEQLQSVCLAGKQPHRTDDRLRLINERAAAGVNETIGADGGFLLQTDFSTMLLQRTNETGVLASRTTKIPLGPNSNGIVLPMVKETSRADGSRWGGVQCYWEEEAAEKTASKPQFERNEMYLKKLIALYYATDELLQDAPALGTIATLAFTEEFGYRIDDAIIRGNGTTQPLGILSSPALITVSKGATGTAGLSGQNVIDMYSRMWTRGLTSAIWLVNQAILPLLPTLMISGSHTDFQLFMPAGSNGVPQNQIMGRPVIPIEQASAAGAVGDILFVDMAEYGMIERGGLQADSSIHVKFTTDETAFRFVRRLNGMPLWKRVVTPANGSLTTSPFVALQAR